MGRKLNSVRGEREKECGLEEIERKGGGLERRARKTRTVGIYEEMERGEA